MRGTWKKKGSRWWVAMVVLWGMAVPAAAAAESAEEAEELDERCTAEVVPGGIDCAVDGEVAVDLRHASLYPGPSEFEESQGGQAPVGGVSHEGLFYYGVQAELYGFDVDERAISWRATMPAPILELEAGESGLAVTVEVVSMPASGNLADMESREVSIAIDEEGLSLPGRGPWDWSATMSPMHDVMWLGETPMGAEPGAHEAELDEWAMADDERAIEALEQMEEVHRTNPFVPLYLGEAKQRTGDAEGATRAFERALDHEHAQWMDLGRMVLRLKANEQPELMDEAVERAVEAVREAGVRPDYLHLSLHATYGLVWFQDLMGQAVEWDDGDGLHGLAEVLWRLYPAVEGWAPMARSLEAYFDRRGEGHRAEVWQERYQEVGEERRLEDIIVEGARATDRYLTLQVGLVLVLFLAGAVIGLWRREDEEDEEGWKAYVPRFQGADLLWVGVLLAVLWALPMAFAPAVQSLITQAEAPPAVMGDALASPTALTWLEGLEESPGRASLVAEAQTEAEAASQGAMGPGEAAIDEQLMRAIEADTQAHEVRSMAQLEPQEQTLQEFEWLTPLIELEFEGTQSLLLFMVLVLNIVVFGGLLQAATRRLEGLRRAVIHVVVGAPNALRWVRVPVFAGFVIGLLLMSPLSRQFWQSQEQQALGLYGMEELFITGADAAWWVGLAMVVLALVAHGAGLMVDRREWSSD